MSEDTAVDSEKIADSEVQVINEERKTKYSLPLGTETLSFNPFSIRRIPWSDLLSDFESFILLTKSVVGLGFLQVPYGFAKCGLIGGLLTVLMTAVISIHANYLWVKCTHEISYRNKIAKASFGDVVIIVISESSARIGRHATLFKFLVETLLFITYFVICCAFAYRGGYYTVKAFSGLPKIMNDEIIIIIVCTAVIVIQGFIPNLKFIANITKITLTLTVVGTSLLFFHLTLKDLPEEDIVFFGTFKGFTSLFTILNFSLHHIGLLLPLENEMENPHHLIEEYCLCGVNSLSLTAVSVFYAAIGYMGSVKYGKYTERYITENLPNNWLSFSVYFFTGLSILGSFPFPYYTIYKIIWTQLRLNFINRPTFGRLFTKTIVSVPLVVCVILYDNHVGYYLSIIGSLCWATVGIITPAILETIVYWNQPSYIPYNKNSSQLFININVSPSDAHGLGKYRWRALKNLFLVLYGIADVCETFYFTFTTRKFILHDK